jgi:hypothetical protein
MMSVARKSDLGSGCGQNGVTGRRSCNLTREGAVVDHLGMVCSVNGQERAINAEVNGIAMCGKMIRQENTVSQVCGLRCGEKDIGKTSGILSALIELYHLL